MTYQETRFPNVENIGPLDRINRIIVGTTLIMVTVLFTAIPAAAVAGIVALGTYAGLTGFIGWDQPECKKRVNLTRKSIPAFQKLQRRLL